MSTFRNLLSKTSSVPGFVGGWKSYGRSNSEDASTRNILPDYSGNGRDIKLYNFAFSGMSGWNGYEQNFTSRWSIINTPSYQKDLVTVSSEKLIFKGTLIDGYDSCGILLIYPRISENGERIRLKVTGVKEGQIVRARNESVNPIEQDLLNGKDGIIDVTYYKGSNSGSIYIYLSTDINTRNPNVDVTIEQLPTYPGALVSDGIDDYGQCIKGFSLPDDYTVVAVRKIISGNSASFVNKGSASGAFLFEGVASDNNISNYSYGQVSYSNNLPSLFSYLSKTSYNGADITPGTATDNDSDILRLFSNSNKYQNSVLYDLRIYDHSLTDEQLQLVKDDMMRNYEKYAKPLDGINYVADFDAKGRSNDEDADVRNKWIDKATGKTIDLNNFAYAGMSGWNGYAENFNDHSSPSAALISDHKLIHTVVSGNAWIWTRSSSAYSTTRSMQVKITGLSNSGISIYYYYIPSEKPDTRDLIDITSDGTYTLPASALYTGDGTQNIGFWQSALLDPNIGTIITIEQLPLYPGALVGDGVDDYGVTQEAINEEVGTIICHYKNLRENPPGTPSGRFSYIYELINSQSDSDNDRMYMACTGINTMIMGEGGTYNSNEPLSNHSKIPKNYNNKMSLFSRADNVTEIGYAAIYRLILIREQLDETQVEFLKWKVEKEYRDWCRANGYEYAINQLTA